MLLQKLKATYHRYPLITSLSVLILFGATLTFATPPTSPYTVGETLDPTCAPGSSNCTVTLFPVQTGNSGKYLTTDGTTASWATISGGGISSLNGLTGATQTFATGTSGSDFGISSVGTTHTFNIPTASGSARGLLSSADWTTFNNKQSSLTIGNLTSSTTGLSVSGGTSAVIGSGVALSIADAVANGSTKGIATFTAADFDATSGVISIDYTNGQAASGSVKGFLTSADWTTFNSKVSSPISLGASGDTLYSSGAGGEQGDTTAGNNTFLGFNSGVDADNASYSTFVGSNAGVSALDAYYSTFVGYNAGNGASTASGSAFFGVLAGQNATNATASVFLGSSAGYQATNADSSIFIGIAAGYNDTVDNNIGTTSSVLIGGYTNTGGYTNSVLIGSGISGAPIANTANNQFMLADTITDVRWSGVEYTLPSAQAGGAGEVLTNDGSGVLSWEVSTTPLRLYKEGPTTNTYSILPAPTGEEGVSIGIFNAGDWPTVGTVGATGDRSFAIGINPLASGVGSIAISTDGDDFTQRGAAVGQGSLVLSTRNARAEGLASIAIGGGTAYSYLEINIGEGNSSYVPENTQSWDPLDRFFNIAGISDGDMFTILKSGITGVGYDNFETTTETALLQVNGSILQTGATSCSLDADADGEIICTVSDQKLKKDITDMSYGLSHIMQLHPVGYNFIDTKYGSGPQIGFIAQELEKVIPEVVTQGPDYKSVNYALLTSVITKAVQELNLKLTSVEKFSFEDTGGFAERLREFFESTTNGIRTIFVKEVQTDKLCVGTTCVTESQLQQLLNQSGHSGGGAPSPSPETETVIPEGDTPEEEEIVADPSPEETSETIVPEEESIPEQVAPEPSPEPISETVPKPAPEVVVPSEPPASTE